MASYNLEALKQFLVAGRKQRIAITGFFNSNGEKDGYGAVGALIDHLSARGVPVNCSRPTLNLTNDVNTGANDANHNATFAAATQPICARVLTSNNAAGGLQTTGNVLDAETQVPNLARYYRRGKYNIGKAVTAFFNGDGPAHLFQPVVALNTSYVSNGIDIQNSDNRMPQIRQQMMLPHKHFVCDFWYGNGSPAGGTFNCTALTGAVPNTISYSSGSQAVATNANPTTMSRYSLDIPAVAALSSRSSRLRSSWTAPNSGYFPTGQVFMGYQLLFEADSAAGAVVAPLVSIGGTNARDWIEAKLSSVVAEQLSQETMRHWFDVICRPAEYKSQTAKCIFFLYDGVNYCSETRTSKISTLTAASPEAFADDLYNLIDQIETDWAGTGRSINDLLFVVCGDQPTTTFRTKQSSTFPAAVKNIVAPQIGSTICYLDIGDWWSIAELQAGRNRAGGSQNYYASSGAEDQFHLAVPCIGGRDVNGYYVVFDRIFDSLLGTSKDMAQSIKRNTANTRTRVNRLGPRSRT